jgi:O-acetyl-ADP-ribose deacetylase (regulator of RNase III)
MGQDRRTNDRYIRQATIATLNLAENLKLRSIAFPAFGTGVGGFPMKACATIMVRAARGYKSQAKHLERIVFVPFDALGKKAFEEALQENY